MKAKMTYVKEVTEIIEVPDRFYDYFFNEENLSYEEFNTLKKEYENWHSELDLDHDMYISALFDSSEIEIIDEGVDN